MADKEFIVNSKKDYIETIIPLKNIFSRTFIMSLILIYILSPVDFIPDVFIPYGFLDDLVSLFFLFKIGLKTWRENKRVFFKIFLFLFLLTIFLIITILYFFMN
ncbi:MAG: DUF1232 domain-containing protein [Candidatus Muirbacterium halophilum]|nr:DUF1232 domain-containing protein [Candidatus Muirbacterium halophilum]MCK9475037.1 DUF1232 domain-containing protein [Candidatus Muirbacterium halophilum]